MPLPVILVWAGEAVIVVGRWVLVRFLSRKLAIAGGTAAAANLLSQRLQYGNDWRRYNWESVGFDYVMGVLGCSFTGALMNRWPARIFSPTELAKLETWVNFTKQQAAFTIYSTIVAVAHAEVSNTKTSATVASQNLRGWIAIARQGALQTLVFSPIGRRLFPEGMLDAKVIFLSGVLSIITDAALRDALGVVPGSSLDPASPSEQAATAIRLDYPDLFPYEPGQTLQPRLECTPDDPRGIGFVLR